MASINPEKFYKIDKTPRKKVNPNESTYAFCNIDGKNYLCIDMYGSEDRKTEPKVSQNIQIDCKTGKILIDLINQLFDYDDKNKTGNSENTGFDFDNHQNDTYPLDALKNIDSELLGKIKSYISSRGFSYPPHMIENFYLCLKSKPFVILSGISGTGKTKLVKLFSDAVGAEFKLVPVRPDWSDSSDLFGHLDLNGKYCSKDVIEFILKAAENPEKPHILCLDEMNLARVEYYFSDILSVIETREISDGKIVSDKLVDAGRFGNDGGAMERFGGICFPENLYIVGTVNMDETTFPFSRKVLDRANTIEFSEVSDLVPEFGRMNAAADPESLKCEMPNSFLRSDYVIMKDCAGNADDCAFIGKICGSLNEVNEILKESGNHVGYRIRDEIVFYMLYNRRFGLLDENIALDFEIMQKILPRISGNDSRLRETLVGLFKICLEKGTDFDLNDTQNVSDLEKLLKKENMKYPKGTVKYPKSAEKIVSMIRRLDDDGFTSYWL